MQMDFEIRPMVSKVTIPQNFQQLTKYVPSMCVFLYILVFDKGSEPLRKFWRSERLLLEPRAELVLVVGGGDDGPYLDAETRVKGRLLQWWPPDTAVGKHSHPGSLGSSPGEHGHRLQRFGQLCVFFTPTHIKTREASQPFIPCGGLILWQVKLRITEFKQTCKNEYVL